LECLKVIFSPSDFKGNVADKLVEYSL